MNNITNEIEISEITQEAIPEIIKLRFSPSSTIFRETSVFSVFGEDFMHMFLSSMIKSKYSVCKLCRLKNSERSIESYFIATTDILMSAIDIFPQVLKFLFKKKSDGFSLSFSVKPVLQFFFLFLNYLFAKSIKHRSCFIEIFHKKDSNIISIPFVLSYAIGEFFYFSNKREIKFFYYSNNERIDKYIGKIASVLNDKIEVLKTISLNGKKVVFCNYVIQETPLRQNLKNGSFL